MARYYDKLKAYRAAVIYYNEVIRQQPGSAESQKAQKRIDQLRAKLGEKMLQPLQTLEAEKKEADKKEAEKKKSSDQKPDAAASETSAPGSAPILPPDLDSSLPPPPGPP